jgi:hypothetical protein
VIGEQGLLLHWNGRSWHGNTKQNPAHRKPLRDVWAVAPNDVWAVGTDGLVLRWDGREWKQMPQPTPQTLYSVWGRSGSSVWTVSEDGVFYWNGASWDWIDVGPDLYPRYVRGIDSELWVMGNRGTLLHRKNEIWERIALPGAPHMQSLLVRSANDVLFNGPPLYHWDGNVVERVEPELDRLFRSHIFAGLAGSKEQPDMLFVTGGPTVGLIEDGRLVAESKLSGTPRGAWANANGEFWAVSHKGIVSWRGAFQFASTHMMQGLFAVSGDSSNIWAVGTQGTILRKRLDVSSSE